MYYIINMDIMAIKYLKKSLEIYSIKTIQLRKLLEVGHT